MAELDVALVAADREVWSGKASLVVAKTTDGDVGIMPQHQPILSLLKPSVITIKTLVDGATGETLHGRAARRLHLGGRRPGLAAERGRRAGRPRSTRDRAQEALDPGQGRRVRGRLRGRRRPSRAAAARRRPRRIARRRRALTGAGVAGRRCLTDLLEALAALCLLALSR